MHGNSKGKTWLCLLLTVAQDFGTCSVWNRREMALKRINKINVNVGSQLWKERLEVIQKNV